MHVNGVAIYLICPLGRSAAAVGGHTSSLWLQMQLQHHY
jgi:hypothetical protein